MSAILSADDLNDFISPGVACIKPVETLPKQAPQDANAYEVGKEGQIPQENPPAQITLTDCLACSGCVTSAEAVLVSLQSHAEVLSSLDAPKDRIFVASVSPQVRASIAATYNVSEQQAGWMIDQLLAGPQGLASSGPSGTGFTWVVDTNVMREAALVLGTDEVLNVLSGDRTNQDAGDGTSADSSPKKPILSSACPGWICYAEKTHPHILPHLSRLKSPQALTGTLLKTVLSRRLDVRPDQIWHLAIMPCFDKKLEASREELTDVYWRPDSPNPSETPVRDVDCVITARELLMLADTRGISFPSLPRRPVQYQRTFPDQTLAQAFFPPGTASPYRKRSTSQRHSKEAGTSGGFLHRILQNQLSQHPGSTLSTTRGRNADVVEYAIQPPENSPTTDPIFKAARYYGFRNIQNLVRKLKPPKKTRMPIRNRYKMSETPVPSGPNIDYAYVEVMACPGGCTNGGGQIKIDDMPTQAAKGLSQKEWLQRVDEAYFSMSDNDESEDGSNEQGKAMNDNADTIMTDAPSTDTHTDPSNLNGEEPITIQALLEHWTSTTGIPLSKLTKTSYRKVESDVGKGSTTGGAGDMDRVAELTTKIGGGW